MIGGAMKLDSRDKTPNPVSLALTGMIDMNRLAQASLEASSTRLGETQSEVSSSC